MKISQVSVFLGNKKGRLAMVTGILAENNINIRSLCIAETTDYGVLRMIVDYPQKAKELLKKHDFVCDTTDIVAVEVPDSPGGLHRILTTFENNDINIEYMYAFVEKKFENAIMIFKIDNMDKVKSVAESNAIAFLTADKIIEEL